MLPRFTLRRNTSAPAALDAAAGVAMPDGQLLKSLATACGPSSGKSLGSSRGRRRLMHLLPLTLLVVTVPLILTAARTTVQQNVSVGSRYHTWLREAGSSAAAEVASTGKIVLDAAAAAAANRMLTEDAAEIAAAEDSLVSIRSAPLNVSAVAVPAAAIELSMAKAAVGRTFAAVINDMAQSADDMEARVAATAAAAAKEAGVAAASSRITSSVRRMGPQSPPAAESQQAAADDGIIALVAESGTAADLTAHPLALQRAVTVVQKQHMLRLHPAEDSAATAASAFKASAPAAAAITANARAADITVAGLNSASDNSAPAGAEPFAGATQAAPVTDGSVNEVSAGGSVKRNNATDLADMLAAIAQSNINAVMPLLPPPAAELSLAAEGSAMPSPAANKLSSMAGPSPTAAALAAGQKLARSSQSGASKAATSKALLKQAAVRVTKTSSANATISSAAAASTLSAELSTAADSKQAAWQRTGKSDAAANPLMACMAAGSGKKSSTNGDAAAFTIQDFKDGKPARLKPELELTCSRAPAFGVTAITALSLSRLNRLAGLCASWKGPLAAAVYIGLVQPQPGESSRGVGAVLASALHEVQVTFSSIEANATTGGCQLSVALLSETLASIAELPLFPFNALRNAALLMARTPLVLVVDGDMLLGSSLSDDMASPQGYARVLRSAVAGNFVVVPAFQAPASAAAAAAAVSGGKASAEQGFGDGSLQMFAPGYRKGHGPTDYGRWFRATEPYIVDHAKGYEPWGIAARDKVPLFDIRFRGYGLDKVSWIRVLDHMGFRFEVHPTAFMVHRPHATSVGRAAWNVGMGIKPAPSKREAAAASSEEVETVDPASTTAALQLPNDAPMSLGGGGSYAASAASDMPPAATLPPKVVADTANKWFGSMGWHLSNGSYKPVVGPGFTACRGTLPWWKDVPVPKIGKQAHVDSS